MATALSMLPVLLRAETGRAETAGAARRAVERRALVPVDARDRSHDQLRDPVATVDRDAFTTMVDQDDPDLAAIIRIDGPGCVQGGHAEFEGQAGTRPHLGLEAL